MRIKTLFHFSCVALVEMLHSTSPLHFEKATKMTKMVGEVWPPLDSLASSYQPSWAVFCTLVCPLLRLKDFKDPESGGGYSSFPYYLRFPGIICGCLPGHNIFGGRQKQPQCNCGKRMLN